MSPLKLSASAAVAASLVGAIALSVAQTPNDTPAAPPADTGSAAPATNAPSDTTPMADQGMRPDRN